MNRFVLVFAALAVPGRASAEEMWRWRDVTGHLHYSNVQANAPADAATSFASTFIKAFTPTLATR